MQFRESRLRFYFVILLLFSVIPAPAQNKLKSIDASATTPQAEVLVLGTYCFETTRSWRTLSPLVLYAALPAIGLNAWSQEAVLAQFPVQIPLADSENPGGIAAVAFASLDRPSDVSKLRFLKGRQPGVLCQCTGRRSRLCILQRRGKMLRHNLRAFTEDKSSFDQVEEFSHVSGPVVQAQKLKGCLANLFDQARDSLTKARVTIHSFQTDLVDQDVQAGLRIAAKNLQAGKEAMVERNRRRAGLGLSLIAIGMVLVELRLYIRNIER